MTRAVIRHSWGSRLIGALFGMLIGIIFIIASFVLIFWNEGHGLHREQALEQVEQVVVTVPIVPIDSKNNLQVIYFNGFATTSEVLRDTLLGVSQQAIKLVRKVEMYQWKEETTVETKKELGGAETEEKTYRYSPVWSESVIDSHHFKESKDHQNPTLLIKSRTLQAKKVRVGDFYLPPDLVAEVSGSTMMDLTYVETGALQAEVNRPVLHYDHGLFVGKDAQKPEIGDLKITVMEVLPQTVSVIAQQSGDSVRPFMTAGGERVSLIVMGDHSPQQMIKQALTENKIEIWLLRFASFLMMCCGLFLIMRPVAVLADIIPFLGSLIDFGFGLIAFMGGLLLWAIGTGIAWFAFRPIWAVGIIICALVISGVLLASRKSHLD